MSEPQLVEANPAIRDERWIWTLLTVVVAGVGLALRIWLLRSPAGRLDSDEAVVALMADSMLAGNKPTLFFAGQFYGGMYEPILTAVAMSIHRSVFAIKAVPLICSAIAAVLTARIARRIAAPAQARFAGAVLFAWPGTTWLSTKERGFYWVMLLLVLVALLSAVRLARIEPHRMATWCVYGAAVGSAWYTSPQSAYAIVPLSLWLAFSQRPRAQELLAATVGFALGAAPWLYGVSSFGTKVLHQESATTSYASRLSNVTVQLLPRVLGTRRVFADGWTFGVVGLSISLVTAAIVVAVSVRTLRARSRNTDDGTRAGSITVLLCVLAGSFPFLAAIPSLAVFTSEPRYGLLFVPTVVLGLAMVATNARRGLAIAVCIMAIATMSTIDLERIARQTKQVHLDLVPSDTRALEQSLHDANITKVYADYWVAYPLTFRAPYGLVASPLDLPRLGSVQQTVDAARATTWIVYSDSSRDRALGPELRRRNISTTRSTIGPFAVYTLSSYIDPLTLDRFWVQHPPGR